MLTNSELFYRNAKKYQDDRARINENYEKQLESLKDKQGSEFYATESERLKKERDDGLMALKKDTGNTLLSVIDTMRRANAKRTTAAPSDEQLRLLKVLQMRESVTEKELSEIAETCKDNALALSVVQEVANKNAIMRNYKRLYSSDKMPSEFANNTLDVLERETRDFVEFDTKRTARISAEYQRAHYGDDNSRPLPKRALFNEKADCFKSLGITPDNLDGFIAAVDGE